MCTLEGRIHLSIKRGGGGEELLSCDFFSSWRGDFTGWGNEVGDDFFLEGRGRESILVSVLNHYFRIFIYFSNEFH